MSTQQAEKEQTPAMKAKLPIIAYSLAALVIILDQLSKHWVLYVFDLPAKRSVEVLPFFDLSMVWNRGVSFGLFGGGQETTRWILSAFAALVSIALIAWVWKAKRKWSAVSIGLILGGALGNLIDRIRFGAVADFLDFSDLYFPWVFNIADAAINVGVALLLIETFLLADRDKSAL